MGVHEDYMERLFCLNEGHILKNMVVIRYAQVYVYIFEFLKSTCLRLLITKSFKERFSMYNK